MKLKLLTFFLCATGIPALAASCGTYQIVGSLCARTVFLGWGAAGLGTQSVITLLNTEAAGPVKFTFTQVSSSMGTSYGGYFAINTDFIGTINSGRSASLQPQSSTIFTASQVCFNSLCNSAAPPGVVPNMFSILMTITANSGADLDKTPLPLLTVQFFNNTAVTFQEQEQALDVTAIPITPRAAFNEGAEPTARYIYNGSAVTNPFTAFSVSNPSLTTPVTVTIGVYTLNGQQVTTLTLPRLPPLGAAGYLLVGRTPDDTLGLLPSSTILGPIGPDGGFHGVYGVTSSTGPVVFLSQEFYGNSMLNALIFQ